MLKKTVPSLLIAFGFSTLVWGDYPKVQQARPSLYQSTRKVKCPIRIVPNESIGPLKIGMTEKEIASLPLDIKEVVASEGWLIVGPFTARLEQSKLVQINAELDDLPNCLRYGSQKIAKTAQLADLRRLFSGCREDESHIGGNLTRCSGIAIGTGGWGGTQKSPSLRIPY